MLRRAKETVPGAAVWRSGAGRTVSSGGRGFRLLALGSVVLLAAGCATKRDLRDLRTEVVALQARQDSLFQQLARQNRELMDSLSRNNELMLRVRGDLGNQLVQMEQQLLQIQELAGQSTQMIERLRRQAETTRQQLSTPVTGEEGGAVSSTPGASAEDLYQVGMSQLQRGNPTTARRAFEQILQHHSTHERAPEAQLQIGETYYQEAQYDSAMQALEQVVVLFPDAAAAPRALYRAGVIAEERGNISRAREYFNRVRSGYPRSDEAEAAAQKLARLRG